MSVARWRIAPRLAARALVRRRVRTLLMILLLAVPLTFASAITVLVATSERTPESRMMLSYGQAKARVTHPDLDDHALADAHREGERRLAALLGGTDGTVAEINASVVLNANDRAVSADTSGLGDPSSPLFDGRFDLDTGALPAEAGDIAISRAIARRLDLAPGDRVMIGGFDGRVTGVLVDPRNTDKLWAVTDAATAVATADRAAPSSISWLIPVDASTSLTAVSTAGWRISERSLSGGTTDPVRDDLNRLLPPALVLAIAFAALLAGAAFALGAAESQRELGLFGVIGAPRRLAGAVLLWQGAYIGAVAAMVGAGGGVGLAALLSSPLAGWYAEIWGPLRPDYLWLALIGVAGFLGSMISCAIATKRVRRTPPLPALQQLPVAVTPSVTPRVVFSALVAAGAFIASLVLLYVTGTEALVPLVGLLAVIGIGMVFLMSQPLLARMAAATPLTVRLACRSVMLAPGRAAAQACMVGAVILLAGVVVTALGGLTQRMEDNYVPALPRGAAMLNADGPMPGELLARAGHILEIDDPIRIDRADWRDGTMATLELVSSHCVGGVGCRSGVSTLDNPQLVGATSITSLEKILGRALTPAERRTWDSGGIIALTPELIIDGHVVEFGFDGRQGHKVPAIAVDVGQRYSGSELPNAYVKATTSKAAVLRTGRQYLWYFPPRADGVGISEKQQDTVTDLVRSSVAGGGFLYVDRGVPAAQAMGKIYAGVAAGAVLLVVGLSIVMIAISARDLAPEWRVLTDAGAAARTRRVASAAIGGVAAAIGTFGGLAATALIYPALASALEMPIIGRPWLVLLGTAAVAVAVTTAFGWILAPKAMSRR